MATTINVKIAPLPRGEWDNGTAYAKLDAVSYNGSSYMAIKATPAGTLPTNTTYWQVLAEQPTIADGSITTNKIADGAVTLDKLGDITGLSGEYDNMVVGSAEQLLSDTYDEESVPYAFRRSPYGDRVEEEIVGGSIAWNQLVSNSTFPNPHSENGITNTWTDGTMAIVGTASTASWIYIERASGDNIAPNNHVYMVKTTYIPNDVRFGILESNGSFVYGADGQNTVLVKNTVGIRAINFRHPANVAYDYSTKPQLFDLTQMFGTAVADYIYGLGQTDGVAFIRSLFPKSYYAYNAGQLISVSGLSAHKMTGFNQFDVDNANLSQGDFNNETSGSAKNVVTRNYTRVVGDTTYAWSQTTFNDGGARYVRFYDADKNFITAINMYGNGIKTFTSPTNACYAKFMWYKDSGVSIAQVQNGNVCINISGDRNGQYEPYEVHSYALDDSLTLRGVPKLVNSKFKFDGDTYTSDGTITRRYGIQDLGAVNINWSKTTGSSPSVIRYYTNGIQSAIKKAPNNNTTVNAICSNYLIATANEGYLGTKVDVFAVDNSGTVSIYPTAAYADADAFKAAMSGVYLVYELATPTTESASPYVNPQYCNEYGTEQFVTTEQSGVAMITGHISKYFANLRKKIEGLPWNFSSLIAPNESTNKASQNYAVGSYLIMNNTLYKVTSAIASGGTITPNTNCVATTIMAEILSL